uniref:Ovule protein n=1 Tax=Heterorhabditis bacteriophora TaxID=37862 RepID=A0A1I7XG02_HETBA
MYNLYTSMDCSKNRLAPPSKDRERRLVHSNSTSRLFAHKKKTIIEEVSNLVVLLFKLLNFTS